MALCKGLEAGKGNIVGARERPLNARVVLLHECAQIAI